MSVLSRVPVASADWVPCDLNGAALNGAAMKWAGMKWGDLLWGAPQWGVAAIGIACALVVLVLWNYSYRGPVVGVRVAAGSLKIIAVLLLAICLMEPLRRDVRPRPQANIVPILVDNSRSMRLKTISSGRSRGEKVSKLLDDQSTWRVRLAQTFDVRTYTFDARLDSVSDFQSHQFDGYVSSLYGSLRSLGERFNGRPIGGVLLFSDGNLTDAPPPDFDWSKLGFPVYPVLPKRDDDVRDLRIADVSVRQTDFESSPMTVRVSVEAVAMDHTKVFVRLIDLANGKVVQEKSLDTGDGSQSMEARFRFRPENIGIGFYRAELFTEEDREAFSATGSAVDPDPADPDPDNPALAHPSIADQSTFEATLANNQRVIAVNRASGPYRILYVGGRPNWEYKFLRRALSEDAEVQLVGLLRIANKEPKFSFRDRGVSGTNPLFAGLGTDEEDAAQQYDEPVILRLGVKESEELSEGFPESAEELFAYHGVILDDLEPGFLTPDQKLLLRRFVSTRGGGLLMLGGQEMFAADGFGDTPLGELSPIYAPRRSSTGASGPVRMALTRDGMLQPWMRLRDTEAAELGRIESMPGFLTLNSVGEIKPGASELAVAQTEDGHTVPAIVTQRFGKGRSAMIAVGDLWRWAMRRDDDHPDDSAQAWRQLAHWLVNEVPKRAEVRVDQSDDPSEPVTIFVTARDEAYLPLDNAKVEIQISPLGSDPFTMIAQADDRASGTYKATYWSRQPGGYHVRADVSAADGSHVGTADAGWTARAGAAEFGDLRLNRCWLKEIARKTGGEVIRDDALDAFAADLPNRKIPLTEPWTYPLWHHPWVMLMAMLCLCCEWGLRRWKGLA